MNLATNNTRHLVVSEYGAFTSFACAADTLGIAATEVRALIDKAIATLGLELETCYEIRGSSIRFTGISGMLALDAKRWIEIIPKFIGQSHENWREDFLWIISKTNAGGLNFLSSIPSSSRKDSSLYDLIARAWCDYFEENERKLIRKYKKADWSSFNIDGDLIEDGPDSLSEEGFLQRGIVLTRKNIFNSLLREAAEVLLRRVSCPQISQRIARAASKLGNRDPNFRLSDLPELPARNIDWSNCVNISTLVLSSSGIGYGSPEITAMPSFVIKTHVVWESFVRLLCKTAFNESSVSKRGYQLGWRIKPNGIQAELEVTPDVSAISQGGRTQILDAKYKGGPSGPKGQAQGLSISNADIYESLAFMDASGCDTIWLVYPSSLFVNSPEQLPRIETVKVKDKTVFAAFLGIGGISKPDGWRQLVKSFRTAFSNAVAAT